MNAILSRWLLPLAASTMVAAACGADTGPALGAGEPAPTSTLPPPSTPVVALPDGPSALRDFSDDAFPPPRVDTGLIIPGGPPPDGIPPIDRPQFLEVRDHLDLLDPAEPVVALEISGDARAYPVRVMIWHEIVNDVVGGVPVTVTYCPLCNSATTFVREINGVETTFGTSGLLFASALVMYDRATESLWTHFDGKAVVGMLSGSQLEAVASPLLSWEDFRLAHPDGKVLDESATGHQRPYGTNPYRGYDDPSTTPFLFRGALDERALAKERIVGVTSGGETKAYLLSLVSGDTAKATNDTVGGEGIVILWKAGQASALDQTEIAAGRDVGSVGVFRSAWDGRSLTFRAAEGRFTDLETSSTWLITGEAVDGPLRGASLERLAHLDTFWFAWATYRPETELVTELP